jgi:hypothetical protein
MTMLHGALHGGRCDTLVGARRATGTPPGSRDSGLPWHTRRLVCNPCCMEADSEPEATRAASAGAGSSGNLVGRSSAAWLCRTTTESIRRWQRAGDFEHLEADSDFSAPWEDLRSVASKHGFQTLDPEWLTLTPDDPLPSTWRGNDNPAPSRSTQPQSAEARNSLDQLQAQLDAVCAERDAVRAERDAVRAERDAVRAERDAARSNAEAIDQAAMAYRDSWKRLSQPQSPGDLLG